jgi:hypothetical protein
MWSATTVLVCALELMGRSAESFPPIAFVEVRPADVSPRADGFVRMPEKTIYLVVSSPAFARARRAQYKCGDFDALRRIASVLIHEEWHVRNGADERGAYQAQLMALLTLDAGPGNPAYEGVKRAMREALALRSRQARSPADRPVVPAQLDGARVSIR